jgi:hypothetical protein
MKRALCSLALGPLFTFLLLTLSPVDGIVGAITLRLLFISSYFGFGKWFGVDCPNADSIADKLTCAWIMLAASALIYALIFYLASFLIWRRKRKDEFIVEHNMAGPTLGIQS